MVQKRKYDGLYTVYSPVVGNIPCTFVDKPESNVLNIGMSYPKWFCLASRISISFCGGSCTIHRSET